MDNKQPNKKKPVGYGNPPADKRWKKGQSGNPGGRKKKPMDIGSIFMREIEQMMPFNDNGVERRATKKVLYVKSLINDAIRGDATSRKLLAGPLDISALPEKFELNDNDLTLLDEFLRKHAGK